MTYISTIQLYDRLSEKIGKEGAEALIQYIEVKIKQAGLVILGAKELRLQS
jgi:hypothetical protein